MFRACYQNQSVDAIEAIMKYGKKQHYYCPYCNSEVQLCSGNIKNPYFSHKKNEACEFSGEELERNHEWHLWVQSLFPKECIEVPIRKTYMEIYPEDFELDDEDSAELITHIADICIGNYVIEVQHSPMDPNVFLERTIFYTRAGYKLIWIIDWNEKYWRHDLELLKITPNKSYNSYLWRVKYKPHLCDYFVPQKWKENVALYFSFDEFENDDYGLINLCDNISLHRITWAIPKDFDIDDVDADYSRIVTIPCLGRTIEEFAENICKKFQ